VRRAVVDHELERIAAGSVDVDRGVDQRGIGQRGRAARRLVQQRPFIGQGIAIHIRRAIAIEGRRGADEDGLIRSGIGRRW